MKFLALIMTIFLVGCGSGSEGTPASLNDIVGVWDDSEYEDQVLDEWYYVIQEDGQTFYYDYKGDSYNMSSNCYERSQSSRLVDLGNGEFNEVYSGDDPSTLNISISGNRMTVNGTDIDGRYRYSRERSSKLISDLTPLCSELR